MDQELGDNAAAAVAGGRGSGCFKACGGARLMACSAQGCQVLQPQRQTHPGDIKEEQVALMAHSCLWAAVCRLLGVFYDNAEWRVAGAAVLF